MKYRGPVGTGSHACNPSPSHPQLTSPVSTGTDPKGYTSLSTGGGPVSCVQLSEGGFQVVYPLGLWSRFSGGDFFFFFWSNLDMASNLFTFTFTYEYSYVNE